MTTISQRLLPVAWEVPAVNLLSAGKLALRGVLTGSLLGVVGLAVVLAFTALLIGAHELTSGGLPAILPPQIRFI